jgi:hypothetical protein
LAELSTKATGDDGAFLCFPAEGVYSGIGVPYIALTAAERGAARHRVMGQATEVIEKSAWWFSSLVILAFGGFD